MECQGLQRLSCLRAPESFFALRRFSAIRLQQKVNVLINTHTDPCGVFYKLTHFWTVLTSGEKQAADRLTAKSAAVNR